MGSKKINHRFFTFGCSFTKYNWPTWADILGKEYPFFYNWGYAGIGNRAIVERLTEAHTIHDINQDDTVIIQWSSHLRHDYARPDLVDHLHGMWKTKGNIFSSWNEEIFDQKWLEKFWNEKAYFLHTLNSIMLAQKFLESIGCKWYMTSMGDLQNIHNLDSNYVETNKSDNTYSVFENNPDLLGYKEKIWDIHKDKWLPNLLKEKHATPELDWWFVDDIMSREKRMFFCENGKFREPHLTYRQYYNYLKKNQIYNLLEINDFHNEETNKDIEYYDNLVMTVNSHSEFLAKVSSTLWASTTRTMGR